MRKGGTTEADVKQAALHWLAALGWLTHGLDIAPGFGSNPRCSRRRQVNP